MLDRVIENFSYSKGTKHDWIDSFRVAMFDTGIADEEVMIFIANILFHNDEYNEQVRSLFRAGYCYHFANMLKDTFQRGRVCVAGPYSHVIWEDTNGCTYDIEGVSDDYEFLVPIEEVLGKGGFTHLPSSGIVTSKEEFERLKEKYTKIPLSPVKSLCSENDNRKKVIETLRKIEDICNRNEQYLGVLHRSVQDINVVGELALGKRNVRNLNLVIFLENIYNMNAQETMRNMFGELRKSLDELNCDLFITFTDDERYRRCGFPDVAKYEEWHHQIYSYVDKMWKI